MSIVGVIQARMGSSRLPGKVMMPLAGRPLIWHIADRIRRAGIERIVLATTVDPRNDPMVAYWTTLNQPVVRAIGEDDIAGRLRMAVDAALADAILKVNADCPLVDPGVMRLLVDRFLAEDGLDYVSNKIKFTWPLGLSAEVISRRALALCDATMTEAVDRELVCNYIRDHPDRFRRASVCGERDLSHLDFSVDTPADYDAMSRLFRAIYHEGECFSLDAALAFLARNDLPP